LLIVKKNSLKRPNYRKKEMTIIFVISITNSVMLYFFSKKLLIIFNPNKKASIKEALLKVKGII